MSHAERAYLVSYDYGTAGLWWWITAASPEAITNTYRNVTVFRQPPTWWSDEDEKNAPRLQVGELAPGLVKA